MFRREASEEGLYGLYNLLLDPDNSYENLIERYHNVVERAGLIHIEVQVIKDSFTWRYSDAQHAGYDCSICLSPFTENDLVSSIGCIHMLHYDCLINWSKVKPNCPICRHNYRLDLIRTVNETSRLAAQV